MTAELSYRDIAKILERLGPLAVEIVLIGGQAVHFWVNFYAARSPTLTTGAPFTSKDIDFCGDRTKARAVAEALHGRLLLPTLDDSTASTGLVEVTNEDGGYVIDSLDQPYGVSRADVDRMSPVVDTGIGDAQFKVLSPILCLESRVCNTGLSGYETPHALRQLEAAIVCAREYLRDVADENPRAFLKLSERVFHFARGSARRRPEPRTLYDARSVDPLDAIPPDLACRPELELFYRERFPRMREILRRDRLRRSEDSQRRAAEAAGRRARLSEKA